MDKKDSVSKDSVSWLEEIRSERDEEPILTFIVLLAFLLLIIFCITVVILAILKVPLVCFGIVCMVAILWVLYKRL